MFKLITILVIFVAGNASAAIEIKDPTRPLNYTSINQHKAAFKLQGIFYGNGRKEAIINGVAVKEGEQLQGQRVIKIHSDAVLIQTDSGVETLRLRQSIF